MRDHNDVIEFNCCNDYMVQDSTTPLRVKIRSKKCLSPGISITKLQSGVLSAKYQVGLPITIILIIVIIVSIMIGASGTAGKNSWSWIHRVDIECRKGMLQNTCLLRNGNIEGKVLDT